MKHKSSFLFIILIISVVFSSNAGVVASKSFYKQKPDDPEAVYFTRENFKISADGKTDFAEKGEFSSITDNQGNVYIADGDVYIFNKEGKQTGVIQIPGRPSTLAFGEKDKMTLFITGRSALYSVSIRK